MTRGAQLQMAVLLAMQTHAIIDAQTHAQPTNNEGWLADRQERGPAWLSQAQQWQASRPGGPWQLALLR
jgi:hypothetical protein